MKRFIAMALTSIFMLAAIISFPVFAASDTYSIPELDMTLNIPSEYHVITRDTPEDHPFFSTYPVSHSAVMEFLESKNIYLNALSADRSDEFTITMVSMASTPLDDFDTFSDTFLLAMMETTKDQMQSAGVEITDYEIYHHSQTKFVKIYRKDTAASELGLQYYTVYDRMAININAPSLRLESEIEAIIDTIHFGSVSSLPADSGSDTSVPDTDSPQETLAPLPTMPAMPTIPEYKPNITDIPMPTTNYPRLDMSDFPSYQDTSYSTDISDTLIISLVISVLLALIPGFIAKSKGRSFWGYFLLSLIISPLIVTIIVLCLKRIEEFEPEESAWTCPLCGTDNDGIYKKCRNCGHEKNPTTQEEAYQSGGRTTPVIPESGTWTCANCGTENKADYTQCKKCGKFRGQS